MGTSNTFPLLFLLSFFLSFFLMSTLWLSPSTTHGVPFHAMAVMLGFLSHRSLSQSSPYHVSPIKHHNVLLSPIRRPSPLLLLHLSFVILLLALCATPTSSMDATGASSIEGAVINPFATQFATQFANAFAAAVVHRDPAAAASAAAAFFMGASAASSQTFPPAAAASLSSPVQAFSAISATPLSLSAKSSPPPRPRAEDSFSSRQDLTDAIRLFEFDSERASMFEDGSEAGGRKVVLCCKNQSCTTRYTCGWRDNRWHIDAITGEHIDCTPSEKLPLPMRCITKLSGVSACLTQQTHELGGGSISSSSLKRAAADSDVLLSPSQATRCKLDVTRGLETSAIEECKALVWWCMQVCVLNPMCMVFLRCVESATSVVHSMTCSSDASGKVTIIGGMPSLSSGHLNLLSLFIIPPYALRLFGLRCSTSAADFARMFHKTDVYAKVMVFLWNIQVAGSSACLMFGHYLGNEDMEMWAYARGVS